MLFLGIESSCDETGVALVETQATGAPRLLSHALFSQIDMHQAYGGVVPELASRDHIRAEGDLDEGGHERDEHRSARLANNESAQNRSEQPEGSRQTFETRSDAESRAEWRVGEVSGEEDDTAGNTDDGCDNDVNNAPSEAIGGDWFGWDGCVHLRAPFMNGNEGTGCEMSPPCAGITQIRFDGRTL